MFLRNVTAIDYAYITPYGRVVGDSKHLDVIIRGGVDPVENVVVDFSSIKKEIKNIIDAKEDGFDHKLWIVDGYSDCEVEESTEDKTSFIKSENFLTVMPSNAIKEISLNTNFFGNPFTEFSWSASIKRAIKEQLTRKLTEKYPGVGISVGVDLNSTAFTHNTPFFFNYIHGLKNSTSWGCQNHSHGHRSWVEFEFFDEFIPPDRIQKLENAVSRMNNAIFIWEENITSLTGKKIQISYNTPRGYWGATYSKERNNIIIMQKETTIENIVEWFVEENSEILEEAEVERVYISEGLQKGAFKDF